MSSRGQSGIPRKMDPQRIAQPTPLVPATDEASWQGELCGPQKMEFQIKVRASLPREASTQEPPFLIDVLSVLEVPAVIFLRTTFIQDLVNSFQRSELPTVFPFHRGLWSHRKQDSRLGLPRRCKGVSRFRLSLFSFLDFFQTYLISFLGQGLRPAASLITPCAIYIPHPGSQQKGGPGWQHRPWISIDPLCICNTEAESLLSPRLLRMVRKQGLLSVRSLDVTEGPQILEVPMLSPSTN